MKNRYPGNCGCGKRVAKERGTLNLVEDVWTVTCGRCAVSGAAPVAAKRVRKPGRRKAATGRPVVGGRGKAVVRKFRRAKRTAAGKTRGAATSAAAPALDWTLYYSPLRYDGEIRCSDGSVAQCTPDYARIFQEAGNATGGRQMDLMVTLLELRSLGHLGEAVRQAA